MHSDQDIEFAAQQLEKFRVDGKPSQTQRREAHVSHMTSLDQSLYLLQQALPAASSREHLEACCCLTQTC
jgi:hypothetical protein